MQADTTILVIDNDNGISDLLTLILEDAGYQAETAADGREGIEFVERSVPDLILLDVRMPVMDGYEFAREFQTRHDAEAPIIVVTADEDAEREAEEIGTVASLHKPFDLDALLDRVARYTSKRRVG